MMEMIEIMLNHDSTSLAAYGSLKRYHSTKHLTKALINAQDFTDFEVIAHPEYNKPKRQENSFDAKKV